MTHKDLYMPPTSHGSFCTRNDSKMIMFQNRPNLLKRDNYPSAKIQKNIEILILRMYQICYIFLWQLLSFSFFE